MGSKKYFLLALALIVLVTGALLVGKAPRKEGAPQQRNGQEDTRAGQDRPLPQEDPAAAVPPEEVKELDRDFVTLVYQKKEYDQAIDMLTKFSEKHPGLWSTSFKFARCYMWMGQLDKALEYLRDAASKVPEEYQVNITFAEVYTKKGDFENARKYADKSLALAKNDEERSRGHQIIAWIYYLKGNYAEARAKNAEALQLHPDNVGAKNLETFIENAEKKRGT